MNNRFFRVSEYGYRFICMLNGSRTVEEALRQCRERDGDSAPTEPEAVQLLAQLHGEGLLAGDIPADAAAAFRRRRRRQGRERLGIASNFLFLRLPLFDPDRLLDRIMPFTGWVFGPVGVVVWVVLVAVGVWRLLGSLEQFLIEGRGVLDPGNLPWLICAFLIAKVLHELGHGVACKRLCRTSDVDQDGVRRWTGGEVHEMGVMLLVLMPVPYVDASSAWGAPERWRRIVVSAAGMWVELAFAAVATIVWAQTDETSALHAIAWNAILIASVSTLLFNANPLLRFDGYYMLSDAIGMPNLAQRGRDALRWTVKRFVCGVKRVPRPAVDDHELGVLLAYAAPALAYRIVLFAGIILFVAGSFPVIGIVLGAVAFILWFVVPVVRGLSWLATSPELERGRARAVCGAVVILGGIAAALFLVPVPDRVTLHGVVQPEWRDDAYAISDGFVMSLATPGPVGATDDVVVMRNEFLRQALSDVRVERSRREVEYRAALLDQPVIAEVRRRQIEALDVMATQMESQIEGLSRQASQPARWAPLVDDGSFVTRGSRLGVLWGEFEVRILAVATQTEASRLVGAGVRDVEVMPVGRPAVRLSARLEGMTPAAERVLPSPAFARSAGGPLIEDPSAPGRTLEGFFRVSAVLESAEAPVVIGQRVLVRVTLPSRPLADQIGGAVRRVLHRRGIL